MLFATQPCRHMWNSVCLATILLAAGCQTGPQAPVANPFLTPQTVPPPVTRVPAPGAAQPYYPGDPVPTLQGALPLAAPPLAVTPAPMPTTVQTFGTVQPTVQPQFIQQPTTQVSQPQFTQPPVTQSQFTQPLSNQPVQSTSGNFPSQANVTQPSQGIADTGFTNAASPAAASSQPPLGNAGIATSGNSFSTQSTGSSAAWRSPGVSGAPVSQNTLANTPPVQSQQLLGAQPTNSSPRIRMPQAPVQQATYVAAAPGVPQTVGITPLQPQQQQPVYYQQAPPANSGWQVPAR